MILPDSVFVRGHQIKIIPTAREWLRDSESFGRFDFDDLTIKVCTGVGRSHQQDTLLHETLHACWALSYLGPSSEEEVCVSNISTELIAIKSDPRNEAWLRFIFLSS